VQAYYDPKKTNSQKPVNSQQGRSPIQTMRHLTHHPYNNPTMSSQNQQEHMCNVCGGVFKNDTALAQHFVLSQMCRAEGEMRRQQTNQKKKRRSFGPGTPAERKAKKGRLKIVSQ
jgi:hypothetical protein